jgi:GrpB-like predicted nucleotidyltransferase (UPF0157 family)
MPEPVVIYDYDARWPVQFEAEKARILAAIGGHVVAVEHIGSTSVSGLGAKPTLDILIAVQHLEDTTACIEPLQALGYQYVPEFEVQLPERRYFRKGAPHHTHHIHMVEFGSDFWTRQLLFRDYLRGHPESAQAYETLKRQLAGQYGTDRDGYTNAKSEFILSILERARALDAGPPT